MRALRAAGFAIDTDHRKSDMHRIWGVWQLDFDQSRMVLTAIPNRSAEVHADVKPSSFLLDAPTASLLM